MHTPPIARSLAACAALTLGVAAALTVGAAPASHGLDPSTHDTTCSPCKDFFQFANGNWVAKTEIPAAYSTYGSFTVMHDRNEDALHALLDDAARQTTGSSGTDNASKIGLFYSTCMDSAAAESQGMNPIEPELARIAALKGGADVAAEVARLQAKGVTALFRFGAIPDFKNSDMTIAIAGQGGLGLPDRDYYTKQDSVSRRLFDEYRGHIARSLMLIGAPADRAAKDAGMIVDFETRLALASMTNVERRDPKATYHIMQVSELRSLAPKFEWTAFLEGSRLGTLGSLNVAQPKFFGALSALLDSLPLEDQKTYLRWHLVDATAAFLSTKFVNEDFRFNKLLTGAREMLPRWKRCARATDQALGEALGAEYVKKNFTPEAKARALEMVKNLEAALHERLATLEWMSDSTRAQATAKLEAFGNKIGYPDRWRDYSTLAVERGPFVEYLSRAEEFESNRQLGKVGKQVDRSEWRMTPPTVNAYYSSSTNDINFPAGILQPPFFDPAADDAVNYGGMGSVIGHEMTHGFDDRGRQFDGRGNLRDWWTPADARRYQERASRVVNEFNGFVAVDTVHVNGKLTLGENIADLGGIALAHAALEKAIAGKPHPLIDGLTPEQRFFLAYARIWQSKVRPEEARTRAATDPHSPPRWRVNGPLSNLPEFAKAFGCKAGDPMVRPDSLQARIW
jgi:putative endopeptidase